MLVAEMARCESLTRLDVGASLAGLAGRTRVEDVADGAADGVEVPEGQAGLAHHGVQIVGAGGGVAVVGAGGAGAGHDAHDGAPSVVRRRRGEGRLH